MNVTPKFKIGDKVSFGTHKGVVVSDVFRLADYPQYPVYIVTFKNEVALFKAGIPYRLSNKVMSAVLSEDCLEKDLYTDIKEGEVFTDRYGTTIKIMINHRDEFILAGCGGNLNKLYSNPSYNKQELLRRINDENWIKQ